MTSLTGKISSAHGRLRQTCWTSRTSRTSRTRRGGQLLLLFLGAALAFAACGDEEVPSPTTPTPPPAPATPAPPPEPMAPGVPSGLRIADRGADFIEWSWSAVDGASGYDVQLSANEAFTDEDKVEARTAEQLSYRWEGLEAEANAYLRVRSAAGTGDDRVTSDWSTHVTGMTTAAAPVLPPVPMNLRVADRGSDYIEWTWDALADVAGYQVQHSAQRTFADSDPTAFRQGAATVTYRVSNLDANTDRYLRVRAYRGSISEPVFGMWATGIMGATTAPPAPAPLPAPTGITAGSATNTTVVVRWSAVTDATSYEVQHRTVAASSSGRTSFARLQAWTNSACGTGGDNEVSGTECTATGLTAGTRYQFRVRALSTDSQKTPSPWAELSGSVTTTGRAPAAPAAGGMGNLKPTWTSIPTSGANTFQVTWIWNRIAGKSSDFKAETTAFSTATNPCASVTYGGSNGAANSPQTSHTLTGLASGAVARLCVRTSNPQNTATNSENLSFAWAVAPPPLPTVANPTVNNAVTTALNWTQISVNGGFNYELKVVEDPQRTDRIKTGTPAAAIQAACDAGTAFAQGDSDVPVTISESFTSSLKPYTGYLLCYRIKNDAGQSAWTVPNNNLEAYTLPARPPAPVRNAALSPQTNTATTTVWDVATRTRTDIPRQATNYNATKIIYFVRVGNTNVTPPTVATCARGDSNANNLTSTRLQAVALQDTFDGIRISTQAEPRAPTNGQDKRIHLCVQAKDGNTGRLGPWILSSAVAIPKRTN